MPLERQRRAEVVPLRRVVVDDVEYHLDPGLVHGLHQVLELGDDLLDAPGGVLVMRGEEGDRVVAPVVGEAHVEVLRHQWIPLGKPFDVDFVEDRLVPGNRRLAIPQPRERGIDHLALRHERCAVALVERQVVAALQPIPENFRPPGKFSLESLGVRVQKQLIRVVTTTGRRFIGAIHPVPVQRVRAQVRQIDVPHFIRVLRKLDSLHFLLPAPIEKAQLYFARRRREQREVDAHPVPRRAQRSRRAFGNSPSLSRLESRPTRLDNRFLDNRFRDDRFLDNTFLDNRFRADRLPDDGFIGDRFIGGRFLDGRFLGDNFFPRGS
jgi:hypothetical protein